MNTQPGRRCEDCPSGFKTVRATNGSTLCVPPVVTSPLQKAATPAVVLRLAVNATFLAAEGIDECAVALASHVARALGISAGVVRALGVSRGPPFSFQDGVVSELQSGQGRRRLGLATPTLGVKLLLDSADAGRLLAVLDAQLAEPSSVLRSRGADNATWSVPAQASVLRGFSMACSPGLVKKTVKQSDGVLSEICAPCLAGEYIIPAGGCAVCGAGKHSARGLTCEHCAPGAEPDAKRGAAACAACRLNGLARYSPGRGAYCSACGDGAMPNVARSACVRCTALLGPSAVGDGGRCWACRPGMQPDARRSACEACGAGRASASGSTCATCPPGWWSAPEAQRCVACAVGRYQPLAGSAACVDCPLKSSTRGETNHSARAACVCASSPDSLSGGYYDSSQFATVTDHKGPTFVKNAPYLAYVSKYRANGGPVGGPPPVEGSRATLEVLSCWARGQPTAQASLEDALARTCVLCPPCFDCSSGTPMPKPGYWRRDATAAKLHRCPHAAQLGEPSCAGGLHTPCGAEYTGVACASCSAGHMPSLKSCRSCPHGLVSFLLFGAVCSILLGFALYVIAMNQQCLTEWSMQDVLRTGPSAANISPPPCLIPSDSCPVSQSLLDACSEVP